MTLIIEELPWDSKFFGIKTVRIIAKKISTDTLAAPLAELKSKGNKLVYIVLGQPLAECNNNSKLVPVGGKAFYHASLVAPVLSRHPKIESQSNTVIPARLYDLALQSGAYSRFKIDTKMPKGSFEKLYAIWIENSVQRKIASEVLVFKTKKLISGLITLCDKNGFGSIGLLSVDSEFRGQHIGRYLLGAANTYFSNKGRKGMVVETQLDNHSARRFYEANDFTLVKKEYIYHYWL